MIDLCLDLLVLGIKSNEYLLKKSLKKLKECDNCYNDELWEEIIVSKELLDTIYLSYLDGYVELKNLLEKKINRNNYDELIELLSDLYRVDDIRGRQLVCEFLKSGKYDSYLNG